MRTVVKCFVLWPTELTATYLNGFLSGHSRLQVNHNAKECVLIRSNKMQRYAGIYLLQVYSTCFGRPSRPPVTAASGTGHSNGATTFL